MISDAQNATKEKFDTLSSEISYFNNMFSDAQNAMNSMIKLF